MNPTIANFDMQAGNDATFTFELSPAADPTGWTLQARIQRIDAKPPILVGTVPIVAVPYPSIAKDVTIVDTFGTLSFSLGEENTDSACVLYWQIQRLDPGHVGLVADGYIAVEANYFAPGEPITITALSGNMVFAGGIPRVVIGLLAHPPSGRLSLQGGTPRLSLAASQVLPPSGRITLTGGVPSIRIGLLAHPPAGQLVFTGGTPSTTIGLLAFPPAGHLVLTGGVPATTIGLLAFPPAGHLTLTGAAPSIRIGLLAHPPAGNLVFTGGTPTTSIGVLPPAGHLVLTGGMPSTTIGLLAFPPAGHLTITGGTPSTTIGLLAHPPAGHLTLTGGTPSTSIGLLAHPPAGNLILTGAAPSISITSSMVAPSFWWKFLATDYNGGSGTTVADGIAGNTASFSGSPTWSTDHPTTGYSLAINNDGGLVLSAAIMDTASSFTMFWRGKYTSETTARWITTGDFSFGISTESDASTNIQINFRGGGDIINRTIASILNAWHSFAWVVDATAHTVQLYMDGVASGSLATSVNQGTNYTGTDYYLGRRSISVTTVANITDYRFKNAALSADDVAAWHAAAGPF